MALMHAAKDPQMRAKMILGEAFSRYIELIRWLERELSKESPEVNKMVIGFAQGTPLPWVGNKESVGEVQRRIAEDWFREVDNK